LRPQSCLTQRRNGKDPGEMERIGAFHGAGGGRSSKVSLSLRLGGLCVRIVSLEIASLLGGLPEERRSLGLFWEPGNTFIQLDP
jgi:hypothetical protein